MVYTAPITTERGGRVRETEERPLYQQLMERIRGDVQSGKYKVSDQIPSEKQLCEEYQVSRVTVRRALHDLTEEGLLVRQRGRGTYVSVPRIRRDLKHVTSFHMACREMGMEPETKVLKAEMQLSDASDQRFFACGAGTMLPGTVRLCMADGEPVMLEYNHYAPTLQWILERDMSTSVYAMLQEKKIFPGQARHEISLRRADEEDARYLGVQVGEALLQVVEEIYDQDGEPLHSSRQHIRGDRFTFLI